MTAVSVCVAVSGEGIRAGMSGVPDDGCSLRFIFHNGRPGLSLLSQHRNLLPVSPPMIINSTGRGHKWFSWPKLCDVDGIVNRTPAMRHSHWDWGITTFKLKQFFSIFYFLLFCCDWVHEDTPLFNCLRASLGLIQGTARTCRRCLLIFIDDSRFFLCNINSRTYHEYIYTHISGLRLRGIDGLCLFVSWAQA